MRAFKKCPKIMIESVTPVFKKTFSGFNTLGLLVFVCLAGVLPVRAQEYTRKINWSTTPKTMTVTGGKKITQPTFKGAAHLQTYGMLPVYTESFPAISGSKVSVQVVNPVYSAATGLDNASIKYITATLNPQGQISYYRKQASAAVSVLPFRKNPASGVIEKLETFTLKVVITPGQQLKSLITYAAHSVLSPGIRFR